jgi:L-ribulokinase
MYNESLGGLPPEAFLVKVDPLLKGVRAKITGRFAASNTIAGRLSPKWAEKLGLKAGIPIPVGAFDAHWDAIGAGLKEGDIVHVVGTSSVLMAIAGQVDLIPGVCGVVKGSVHPDYFGIEAGLAACGEVFEAIARRANSSVAALSEGLTQYRPGQTGLLRMVWDNGDRTVLVNPELGGITLGWTIVTSAQDELFAAIEGTAYHTRIILERMGEYGVPINRIINAGGIPRKNPVLNQIYADVLNKPVLVPREEATSLGAAIFAFLAAGVFPTIEAAQEALCPQYDLIEPRPASNEVYEKLFGLFRPLYFGLGRPEGEAIKVGGVLPELRKIAAEARV